MRLSTLLLSLIASSVCVIAALIEPKANAAAPPKAKSAPQKPKAAAPPKAKVAGKSNSAAPKKPNVSPKKPIPAVEELPTDPVARAKVIAAGKRPVQPAPPDPKMVARATVDPVVRAAMAMDIAKDYVVKFDRTDIMNKEFRDQTFELTDSILRNAAYGDPDCLRFIDRIKAKMYGGGDPETSAAGEARAEAWAVATRLAAEVDRESNPFLWRSIQRSVGSFFNFGSSRKSNAPSTKASTKASTKPSKASKASTKPPTKPLAKSSKASAKQPTEASSGSSTVSKSDELVPTDSSSSSDSDTSSEASTESSSSSHSDSLSEASTENGSINSRGTKNIIVTASIAVAVILAGLGYAVWNNRKHRAFMNATNVTTDSILNSTTISASSPVTITVNTTTPLMLID